MKLQLVTPLLAVAASAALCVACSAAPDSSPAGQIASPLVPASTGGGGWSPPQPPPSCTIEWSPCDDGNTEVEISCAAAHGPLYFERVDESWVRHVAYVATATTGPTSWVDVDPLWQPASLPLLAVYSICNGTPTFGDSCINVVEGTQEMPRCPIPPDPPPPKCHTGTHLCGDECVPNGHACI
jgi:hypothetical protein